MLPNVTTGLKFSPQQHGVFDAQRFKTVVRLSDAQANKLPDLCKALRIGKHRQAVRRFMTQHDADELKGPRRKTKQKIVHEIPVISPKKKPVFV